MKSSNNTTGNYTIVTFPEYNGSAYAPESAQGRFSSKSSAEAQLPCVAQNVAVMTLKQAEKSIAKFNERFGF